MLSSPLSRLRLAGVLEGSSFLVLLFVAMPLKYLAGEPGMVRFVGSMHGLLFVVYLISVLYVAILMRWPLRYVAAAVAAAVLPFGPFILDARLLRGLESHGAQS